jgi:hypothetical protein
MTNQKIKPCPKCQSADYIGVASYDTGSRRVECDAPGCWYIGPLDSTKRNAIKRHNERCARDAKSRHANAGLASVTS